MNHKWTLGLQERSVSGSIAAALDESVCAEPSTNVPNAVAHPSPALIADAFDTGSDAAKKPA